MNKHFAQLLLIVTLLIACGPAVPPSSRTATVTQTIAPSQTPHPTQTAILYPTKIIDTKDVEMALVPAGEFTMGDNGGQEDVKPAHTVYLDAFYIDVYEVTNAQYENCVVEGVCQPPIYNGSNSRSNYYGNPQYDNYPVIYVNWDMAKTYCEWRGADLPIEAQWEKAARGTDARTYPWGEDIPDCNKANYSGPDRICVGDTTVVGNYKNGKSPYGIYDMAGNVWEWVADWYSETYYQNSPITNPLGPELGQARVVRGGAWLGLYYFLRASGRHSESYWQQGFIDVGLRCSHALP